MSIASRLARISKDASHELIAECLADDKLLTEMVAFSLDAKEKHAWRAAWVLHQLAEQHNKALLPFLPQFLDGVLHIQKDGHIRELLAILLALDCELDEFGDVMDFCIQLLGQERADSPKAYAIDLLLKIAEAYPEIQSEIIAVLEDNKENFGKRYLKIRAEKAIKKLKRK